MRLHFEFCRFLSGAALVIAVSSPAAAFAADPNAIDQAKKAIVKLAEENQTRLDNILTVQQQMQPLVQKLLELSPSKPEAAQTDLVVGGWRNLWANLPFPPTVDLTQNYQVVTDKGFYYNVSRQTLFGTEATGYLRGEYTDAGSSLAILFTRNALAPGWPAAGTSLLDLAAKVEDGSVMTYDIPGPNGVTGTLKNAYVDSELRVITGGDSLGESGLLFIMERSATIAAP